MRKAVVAAALLAALCLGSVLNLRHLERLSDQLTARIEAAQAYDQLGDGEAARREVRAAIDLWRRSDGYTHIFIRHAEIDAATDALYDALGAVGSDEAEAAYGRLLARLSSMVDIERVTLKSVF